MTKTFVNFEMDGVVRQIEIDQVSSPKTVAAFLAALPATVDLHCAKVAGNQFYWHGPFLLEYEASGDVTKVPAGSVVFWPERQLVEVIYGELHPEAGSVNLIGTFVGDLDWLTELGNRNARVQGRQPQFAKVYADAEPAPLPIPPGPLGDLRAARIAVWEKQPAEFDALLQRRGLMLPYGPLMFAESELRKLHEVFSRLWLKPDPAHDAAIAAFVTDLGADRLDHLCGLHETAATIRNGKDLLISAPDQWRDVLTELALYTSRLAAWLDLHICWFDLTDTYTQETT